MDTYDNIGKNRQITEKIVGLPTKLLISQMLDALK